MNARFLHTFCCVAELGSLNAAARRLGLSSTSVSEQIRTLEKELKVQLVTRSGRTVALTESGRAILPAARDIGERINELRHIAQLDKPRGVLRIGAAATVMISILPAALRRMAQSYPDIELKIYPGSAPQLYRLLESDDVDCVISGRPSFALPKRLTWDLIRKEPLTLVCPGDVKGGDIDSILAKYPFIRTDRNSWVGQLITRFLDCRDIRTRDLFEMDALQTIVILVAQGLGVSLLPDWGIKAPTGSKIRRVRVGDPAYDRHVGIIGVRSARARLTGLFIDTFRVG